MHKVILLGNSAIQNARSELSEKPEKCYIVADSFHELFNLLKEGEGHIVVISRDAPGFGREELFRLRDLDENESICFIWPPDDTLSAIISSLSTPAGIEMSGEQISNPDQSGEQNLIVRNQELTERITALEAVVRSLLTALSQFDLSYEAYTGEEDAWKLIMRGLPAAELSPDDFLEDESGEIDEEYDDSEGN